MSKKNLSILTLQYEWFFNPNLKLRIDKSKVGVIYVRNTWCRLCYKEINIGSIGVGALDSHAEGKKRENLVSPRSKNVKLLFVGKRKTDKNKRSKVIKDSVFLNKKCVNKCEMLHKGWTMDCDINNNTLNTEISWCFSSCRWHLCYNFCWTLKKIFQSIFRNIEISSKLSMGKWKCRHMLICDSVFYVDSSLIF